jgi:hypothetical protein
MAMQITEGILLIAMVALVLTQATGFSTFVGSVGTNYAALVRGLRS